MSEERIRELQENIAKLQAEAAKLSAKPESAPKTDWNQPIDWKSLRDSPDGAAKVKAKLDEMWAEGEI